MSRIMGIDYGLKRIGVALTDMLQITANPFDVIESVSLKKDAQKIYEIAQNNQVETIVVGIPLNDVHTEMAETVNSFISKLKELGNMKIETVDESFTTNEAMDLLVGKADASRKKQKGVKDKLAAAIILQRYLEKYQI
ncbi:Holliday junction resolvase RuvX [Endomicrobium proavitum]|uniref:Putative pre-16S rRNA nuclease n=1 Tax=Endomicrobium proavitum TaxID=1408281 RepID=A0A0G3WHJ6_9BACT|nr:Holliday junction resolvase RuvX [Endomicrobium proavitum]AKL98106.1 putative Holliday junction resolvase [Endomicrobium proavitum]